MKRSALVGVLVLITCASEATAATYTVTNSNGSGAGSLVDAIAQANLTAGPHVISFDIPGAGPHVIPTASPLSIAQQITIDGTTQPGFAGTPIIVLDGSAHIASGLSLSVAGAGGSVIRGLVFSGYQGIGIYVSGAMNVVIEGNYVGVDPTGTLDVGGSSPGVMVMDAIGTRIGGATAAQRNVLGGSSEGVMVQGTCNGTVIRGNYIGTNAAGTAAIANSIGVRLLNSNGLQISDNVISGNSTGITLHSGAGGYIYGNRIGLNAAGTAAIPNVVGIAVQTPNAFIGGPNSTPAERNVISGNTSLGIVAEGDAAGLRIYNNFIGTNPAGTAAIPNGGGVALNTGANGAYVGGPAAGQGNLISGNTDSGVTIARVTSGYVFRNLIGTTADGVGALGNGSSGVLIFEATGIQVGTSGGGTGNTIAHNDGYGIQLMQSAGAVIDGNSIHSNTQTGLGGDSLIPATATVTAAANQGNTTRVTGTLQGEADREYHLQLHASPTCDPSGSGEGATPFPLLSLMTGGDGAASFSLNLPAGVPVGHVITATVIDTVQDNTSSFSACRSVCPQLGLDPATLPAASPGAAYAQALTGSGGSAPYTVTLASGTLPAGITLASNMLSGTTTQLGGSSFVLRVTDDSACSSDHPRTLSVQCGALAIAPATLPDATVGVPYAAALSASGGAAPYTYYVSGQVGWLALDSQTGALGGVPDVASTLSINVQAIDSSNCQAFESRSIAVNPSDAPDAGVPDAGGTGADGGDPGADGGGGGCGCSGGAGGSSGAWWLLVGLAALLRRRRPSRHRA